MKKLIAATGLVFAMISSAQAAVIYPFSDKIDNWGPFGALSTLPLVNGVAAEYTHDINSQVDFARGDKVTQAWLDLDFTNDATDGHGSALNGRIRWDFREYATVGLNDQGQWVNVLNLGEVDSGVYSMILDIDWLNDDGLLDVSITVTNPLGTAVAWLDHSELHGFAQVPEPATIALLGLGLAGLGAARMRKAA